MTPPKIQSDRYNSPRCGYCTNEIKQSEPVEFYTMKDGGNRPLHRPCKEEYVKESEVSDVSKLVGIIKSSSESIGASRIATKVLRYGDALQGAIYPAGEFVNVGNDMMFQTSEGTYAFGCRGKARWLAVGLGDVLQILAGLVAVQYTAYPVSDAELNTHAIYVASAAYLAAAIIKGVALVQQTYELKKLSNEVLQKNLVAREDAKSELEKLLRDASEVPNPTDKKIVEKRKETTA